MAKTAEQKAAEKAAKDAKKAKEAAAKAAAKAAGDSDSVTVQWSGGERTFTRELNGEDFAELAASFATKHNGTIVEA